MAKTSNQIMGLKTIIQSIKCTDDHRYMQGKVFITLMTVWMITGKIIRTTIIVNYICTRIMEFYNFRFSSFFSVLCFCKG